MSSAKILVWKSVAIKFDSLKKKKYNIGSAAP